MTTICCPLTHSANVRLLQTIKSSDVIRLYQRINLDVSPEFNGIKEFGFYYATVSSIKFFYPAVCGSPLFYQQLQRNGNYYEENKFEFGVAAEFIKPFARILEVGCGEGAFARFLASKRPYYLGIESNPTAVAVAQAAGINVRGVGLEELVESGESTFDVICAFQVLEHIADAREFLEKMLEMLSPNGYLILSVPDDDGFIGKTINHIYNIPPHHVTRWNERAFRRIAEQFKLQMRAMAFEPLPDAHRKWHREALQFEALRTRFFRSRCCAVDMRLATRALIKLSNLLAAMKRRKQPEKGLRGHTLVGVFQK